MGEGNHLPVPGSTGKPAGRWMWLLGSTAVAVVAGGMLMQYVCSPATKAAADPPAGQARVGRPAPKADILSKVGKDSITYDAVAEECVKRFGREVLDDLIHRLIIQQACEENNITVSDQEISDEIARIAKRFNLDVNQWLQMLQAERNVSPVQYRQSVIFPLIAMKKLAGENVKVEPEDMNEAFVRNYGPRVKARMIMFDSLRRAQLGLEKILRNPDDFEELAGELSVDQNSRALGGQIPPIPMYNGQKELEEQAFKLKKGQISPVIEVGNRFVVLKSEGKTEPVVSSIDDVRSTLYDELKESKVQADVATLFEKIKKKTIVENYLTGYSNRPERSAGEGSQKGVIQPVNGTQAKPNSSPARSANSGAGSSKSSRN